MYIYQQDIPSSTCSECSGASGQVTTADQHDFTKHILPIVIDHINRECSMLCRKGTTANPPPFRKIVVDSVEDFTWSIFSEELSSNCPVLHSLLNAIVSHSDHRNVTKQGSSHLPGVCMAIAVLLKERNREMCGLQSVIGLLLYKSHVQSKVGPSISA